ncbi:MAG: hypothetical protein LBH00_12190, partial [Planctomycetaceae bacterium]|nr:hypothetical protein [Planctomycetaceae bacterium]
MFGYYYYDDIAGGSGGSGAGSIGTAILNSGTLYNGYNGGTGTIDHLIYNGGNYYANFDGGTSSLEKLTLGTTVSASQGLEFTKSNLKELAFSQDYGVINITGTVNEN